MKHYGSCRPALRLPSPQAHGLLEVAGNKMEPTIPNANTYSKTRAQTFFYTLVRDTLVERSCGTLSCDTSVTSWDTVGGHSCKTLLWTLVQLSCGTLLKHSSTTLTSSAVIWPHKLTVLRPQLPEVASRTTFGTTKIQTLQLPEAACPTTCVLPSGQF